MGRKKMLWTPADWHSGSNTALAMPEWTWGDGTTVLQTKTQSVIRKQHIENLQLIKEARKGRELHIVFAGDARDGNHHGTAQIITPDEDEHSRIFIAVLEEALDVVGFNPKKGDTLRFLLGTDSHVSGSEEAIAKYFYDEYGEEAVPPKIKPTPGGRYKDGRFLREKVLLDINGVLFSITHQPKSGPGSRAWTTENALRATVKSNYFKCLDHKQPIPNYWVWAHRHQFVRSGKYYGEQGESEGVLLPAKQAKTEYGTRVASDNLSHIGDVWWIADPDGYEKMFHNILKYDDGVEIEKI